MRSLTSEFGWDRVYSTQYGRWRRYGGRLPSLSGVESLLELQKGPTPTVNYVYNEHGDERAHRWGYSRGAAPGTLFCYASVPPYKGKTHSRWFPNGCATKKKTKEDKTRRKNKSTNRGINLNGSWHKDHSHHIQYPDFSRSSIWDLTLLSSEHKLFPNHSSGIEGLLV